MADTTIAITALIVGVLGALGACIREIHLRKVKLCCINSDCIEERRSKSKASLTPPETPIAPEPSQETKLNDDQVRQLLSLLTASADPINYVV
jgi:hypothetical protein